MYLPTTATTAAKTSRSGESANPARQHLPKLADNFKMKNADSLLDEVHRVVKNWNRYASDCGVSRTSKYEIQNVINQN